MYLNFKSPSESEDCLMSNELMRAESKGNMQDFEKARKDFTWAQVEKEFDWSNGGVYNVAHEIIDRHAASWRKNKIALYWIGPNNEEKKFTFGEMKDLTNRFANAITKLGAKKGDRVFIYMDRLPELYVATIGSMKMGAVASPLFSALGPEAVQDRALDAGAKFMITQPYLYKRIESVADDLGDLSHIIMVRDGPDDGVLPEKGTDYQTMMNAASDRFQTVNMSPADPYVVHYTSGSTGKPKGVILGHKAMIQEYVTARWVLDLKEEDTYWCTADPGWVTGTSYGIVGPWLLGTSMVTFAGRFDPKTWYSIIERHGVTVWYTAPTALRMLMKAGNEIVKEHDFSKLRHICSVGEPLNAPVIRWGMDVFGKRIHDTWWQTETGAQMICNYPCMDIKPGSMGKPIPGVSAGIVDEEGKELPPMTQGMLAIRPGWPSMMVSIWRNAPKFREYFRVPGWFVSGDNAYMDHDGYYWFIGRADDVIKTSGERIGPFEVESALVEHQAVAEAGVIGKPDEVRGEIIKAFVILRDGFAPSDKLKVEISDFVKAKLSAFANPREIEFVDKLPKTRSGKIMRRVLKARELGLEVGDLLTMEE
jgi:acetyl-CoA synthetase